MHLSDAHCHLQDARLRQGLPGILATCREVGIRRWMVNATREEDWPEVAALSQSEPGVLPAFGLHPWWQAQRSPAWIDTLRGLLRAHPAATLGETGLDQWMEHPNLRDQRAVLETHLALSREFNRAISLHCLRAWPELERCVRTVPASPKGFLLHGFSGPPEKIPLWVELGAYFSFPPAFLHPGKAARRAAFQLIPLDRLLVETDAPDMAPPEECAVARLPDGGGGRLNHPANLRACVEALAVDRGLGVQELAGQLEANFENLFGA